MAELYKSGGTAEGRLYISSLKTLDRLEIQYVPEEVATNRVANHGKLAIIGRNNPVYHYTGGSDSMSLELDFYSEQKDREDVMEKCSWLESLAMNDGDSKKQERILLTFGDLFKVNKIWLIKRVVCRYRQFDAKANYLPVQAYVTLDLVLDPESNLKRRDVKWR